MNQETTQTERTQGELLQALHGVVYRCSQARFRWDDKDKDGARLNLACARNILSTVDPTKKDYSPELEVGAKLVYEVGLGEVRETEARLTSFQKTLTHTLFRLAAGGYLI